VLFLFVCLSIAFISWFVCRKMLTWCLPKRTERLDTFYARRNTSSWLLCDQTTWFERKLFCSPFRSERETLAGVLAGSFTMVGSQIREGDWTWNLSEFTCHGSRSSCWRQSCSSLLVAILPWSKLGTDSFQILGIGLIVLGCCTR
jgi:hypothetical protein